LPNCRYLSVITIWLLVGILLSGPGTAYAQTKQYVTAADYQWVYDAMQLFSGQGDIANYPKDWVKSGHDLSRIEVAYYLKQLLENNTAAQQSGQTVFSPHKLELIQRLMEEFTDELTALGINTTEIEKISPKLIVPAQKPTDYQDLDLIIGPVTGVTNGDTMPCYYFGQYYAALQRKEFVFLPAEYVAPGDIKLLESGINDINVVYQLGLKTKQLFLIIKGDLPVKNQPTVAGYFLFPLADRDRVLSGSEVPLGNSILALVDEVKQLKQVDNIQRMEGRVSLNGYFKLDTGINNNVFKGNIDQGIKIGSLLVYADDPAAKLKAGTNQFGLPSYTSRQSTAVDWDVLKQNSLDSLQIKIKGSLNLSPQTAVYGGIDLLYQESDHKSLFEGLLPPEAKYSAGVNYQMSNYWKLLSYQSFVSSSSSSELLSTTSLGVEYNNWITLWLAYQMLDFKSDRLTGVITLRF
jgi:hypothetical protein